MYMYVSPMAPHATKSWSLCQHNKIDIWHAFDNGIALNLFLTSQVIETSLASNLTSLQELLQVYPMFL